MVSFARFGELRLNQFLPRDQIELLDDWEYMDHMWVGEAFGFSEWLRLETEPDVLRSLAINLADFPVKAARNVLKTIDLPIRSGMTFEELHPVLGTPAKEVRFVKDRVTFEFILPRPLDYSVSCTVLNDGGLTYLVVMAPLPSDTAAEDANSK